MASPWEPEVSVVRAEEHEIVGVKVIEPGAEDRFGIEFTTDDNHVLRVMLPAAQLQALVRVLSELANERASRDDGRDVPEPRELIS
jgi:hypothetical protein